MCSTVCAAIAQQQRSAEHKSSWITDASIGKVVVNALGGKYTVRTHTAIKIAAPGTKATQKNCSIYDNKSDSLECAEAKGAKRF